MRYETYKPSGIEWIGDIPEHWEVKRLKDVADIKFSSIDKHSYDDEESVKLCNYVDVYKNEFIDSSISFMDGSASESEYEKLKLQKGDVLVTKDSETPQDIAIPALVNEDLSNVVCGYHLALIRPHKKISGGYLFRLFQTKPINAHFEVSANGITRYGLGVDAFGSLRVFSPPLPEQSSISTYLDSQTQKIDQLIANKKVQVERLKELRQIEINNAVTKGLNPHAPMKDSGVEWLGQIPGHWEVKRLKNVSNYIQTGATPSSGKKEYYEGEIPWYGPGGFTGDTVLINPQKTITQEAIDDGEGKLFPADCIFMVGIGATIGKVAIIKKPSSCNQQLNIINFKNFVNPDFGVSFLKLYENIIINIANFSTLPIYNQVQTGNLKFLVPPLDEQHQISNYLQQRTAAIDKLIKNTVSQIEKFQELRKIKIYEAVTGKVKCHA